WEYFTYRYGAQGNCEGGCPSGMLRIVAIADINNGTAHPPVEQLDPQGIIGSIIFRVMNDANLGGQNIPIGFFWYDCSDNSFSDPTGQFLLVDQSIYSAEGNITWDEANDASFPEEARPDFLGAADSCLAGDKTVPVRCVTFRNGSLCIIHPDSIDARGDMNLNGISYEIADAVVYTNYFIIGLKAFSVSIPGQIAASDINGDGLTLTVADLVYLIRVITGDAVPYAKDVVPGGAAELECITFGSSTRVTVDAVDDIGAALLVFSYEGERPGDPVLGPAASQMDMKFAWTDENTLRVLLYSFEVGHKIESDGDLLEIPFSGNGGLVMKEADMADYYGRPLATTLGNSVLPRTMDLTQNRPNPFNPTTTFQLGLPVASAYTVEIYNISGQIIRSWSGSASAGYVTFEWNGDDNGGQRVASGIYFYRARAAGTEAIRKMILVK
ncbi:MAG: FlgD immunoglobulin-like domain containing protein, partial [candidate division Zixibacteria bacterium]|nr:FlgD immunoglobulin-like domain containing protein [candidate division Zixibacteria bacterium]